MPKHLINQKQLTSNLIKLNTQGMSVKIGINGFGRIGRLMFRQAFLDLNNKFKIMAINDSKDIKYLMYMLKYDSVHGKMIPSFVA